MLLKVISLLVLVVFAGSNDNLLTNYFYSPYNVTAYTNQIILPDAPATKTGTGLIFGANPNTMNISFLFWKSECNRCRWFCWVGYN